MTGNPPLGPVLGHVSELVEAIMENAGTRRMLRIAANLIEGLAQLEIVRLGESPPPPEPVPSLDELRPPPRQTYGVDGPPPVESEVTDNQGSVWRVGLQPSGAAHVELVTKHDDDDPWTMVGDVQPWGPFLLARGPVTLNDQDPTDADLYGPWGGRWGVPGEPCPAGNGAYSCQLGRGHTGPHKDYVGRAIVIFEKSEPLGPTSVTPHEAAEVICTCGSPAAHKVTCPRYQRIHGGRPTTHMVMDPDDNDNPALDQHPSAADYFEGGTNESPF